MGEQNNQPVFTIEKLYVKDLSLEVPGAPQIFREREAPQVDVSMNNAANRIDDGHFEVVINITITAKIKDKTVFLVETAYGGVFQIRNVPEAEIEKVIAPQTAKATRMRSPVVKRDCQSVIVAAITKIAFVINSPATT